MWQPAGRAVEQCAISHRFALQLKIDAVELKVCVAEKALASEHPADHAGKSEANSGVLFDTEELSSAGKHSVEHAG